MSIKNRVVDKKVLMIFGITLIAVMGVASISPVLPSIQEHFKLEKGQIKWLISVFSLPGFLLSFLFGVLADRWGRKTILIPSLLIFSISGFLCSFSNSFQELLVYRFFQGVGAASLSSVNNTLIGDLYEGNKRIKIMGYNASVLSIGTAILPTFGGLISGSHWQVVFYLPLLALPLTIMLVIFLKPTKMTNSFPIAIYLKSLWLTVNQRKIWGLFLTNLLVFIILYGAYLTFFPILLKLRFLAGPTIIGLTMSVTSISTAISASQLSKLRKKINAKKLLYFSAGMYAVSMVLIGFSESWGLIFISIILFGIAHGLYIPNIQSLLVGLSPVNERAAFMSLNSMILRFGQFLGPILIGALYINNNLLFSFLGASIITIIMIFLQKVLVKIDEN